MTEGARRWLWEVYQHTRASSRESLHAYFRGQNKKEDLTAEVLNMLSKAVKSLLPEEVSGSLFDLSYHSASKRVIDKSQCAVYLYYMVAEHILQQLFPQQASLLPVSGDAPPQRFKGLIRAAHNPECYDLISSQEFHMPLIECALYIVAFITEAPEQHYPTVSEQLQRSNHAAVLWWAAGRFRECFNSDSTTELTMPADVQQYLQQIKTSILDRRLLATGSLFYTIMEHGGGGACKSGDKGLIYEVLRAYVAQAIERAQIVGWYVQIHQSGLHQQEHAQQQQQKLLHDNFHEQCAWLMDQLLLHHLDVCFGQHMSVLVACVVYVAAKLDEVNITFKRITEVLLMCCSTTSSAAFQSAELSSLVLSGNGQPIEQPQYGDIRMYYNARFLPAIDANVRQYMQEYQQFLQPSERSGTMEGSFKNQTGAAPVTPPTNSRQPLTGLTLNGFTQPVTDALSEAQPAVSYTQWSAGKQEGVMAHEGSENIPQQTTAAAARLLPAIRASDKMQHGTAKAMTLRSMR